MPDALPNEHFAGVGANAVPHWGGDIAFEAIGNLGSQGFYWRRDGVVQKVFLRGEPVPGSPGEVFHFVTFSSIHEGEVAFEGWAGPPNDELPAVFHWDGMSIRPVVDSSTPLPGFPDETFLYPQFPSVFEGGITFFSATSLPDLARSGVWEEKEGDLQSIAARGAPGPGDPPGGVWTSVNEHEAFSRRGMTTFFGATSLDGGIWRRGEPGSLPEVVVRPSDPFPGGLPGETFQLNFGGIPPFALAQMASSSEPTVT